MEKILDLIFIPNCLFCKELGSFFCDKCLSSCTKLPLKIVKPPNFPAKFLFIYEYERFIRESIRTAKYRNRHFASFKVLSEKTFRDSTIKGLLNIYTDTGKSLVLPVPISKAKLKKRGFNQAELIAQKMSKTLGNSYNTDLLIRAKETVAQYTNNRRERFNNVKDAFGVKNKISLADTKVILVDDVCTTGATFIEAAKVLFQAGAKDVLCFALARKSL